KKFLVAMGLVAFAVVGCDDSSSASAGPNDDPGVESSSSNVSQNGAKQSSSSEKTRTSSSSVDSVSSSSEIGCKTETEDNCEYGELIDDRDGQIYKTVKIGDQWWMAQNLNYAYLEPTADEDSSSFCFKNDDRFCVDYGRLYLWSAAMDSTGIWSANVKERGVCPDGWHLPSEAEWDALFKAVGGGGTAALVLKSTSGWYNGGNGTDAFGFSVLPADYRTAKKDYYYDVGERAYFWSSSECYNRAVVQFFAYDFDYVQTAGVDKDRAYSVRCLKD
ncbi:fibrobacter succinogenes major paralogous domain-containing protein, partial [Fibrobacter sp.]|uniref:fibrobacter succinogenes major paralogous domain-containing protein n=1 Tax=Fibrobacter sp. TaxID=35828 RepID=UPI003863986E